MLAGSRGFTPRIPVGSSIQFFMCMCLRSRWVVCWLCAETCVFTRGIHNAIKTATANKSRPKTLTRFFIIFLLSENDGRDFVYEECEATTVPVCSLCSVGRRNRSYRPV